MRLILFLVILSSLSGLKAQIITDEQDRNNPGPGGDQINALMFAIDYTNNSDITGKLGETIDQPSFSASMTFMGKSGFDASVIGFYIGNSDESLENYTSEIDLMVGYNFELFEFLSIRPGYSHFFFGRNSIEIQKIFSDELHVDLDFKYKFVNLVASPGFYLGKQHTFHTSLRNFYSINLSNVFFKNTLLNIQPGFDLNFGDFEYLNRFYVNELKQSDYFYEYLLLSRQIRHYVYIEKTQHPELTIYEILDQYLNNMIQDRFKLTSAFLYLPVNYFAGNFCFNFGVYTLIPIKQPDYLYNDVQFFFDVGISYSLIL